MSPSLLLLAEYYFEQAAVLTFVIFATMVMLSPNGALDIVKVPEIDTNVYCPRV